MAAADQSVFPVPPDFAAKTLVTAERFKADYDRSLRDPEGYWGEQGRRLTWAKPYTKVRDVNLTGDVRIRWFYDGELNVAANCLDRHLAVRGDQPALIWEPDRPEEPSRTLTYRQLHSEVCRFANVLAARGVKKGDRVTLYLPMIPETAVAMLACARIGAIHSIVFAGFSTEALADRIQDAGSVLVITGDYSMRGGKQVPLKATVDGALGTCPSVRAVLVVKRTGGKIAWKDGRDFWYGDEMAKVGDQSAAPAHNAEDPLFILYTSGSTGKPKGAVHTMGGYLLYASMTHELAFDYKPGEVYWCTADVGWVTGHSYIVYGPLANGATSLMFEGVPTFPDASRCWQVIDKHRVNIFYTAPTLIRSLMREGDKWLTSTSRKSLRVLGSVGEPINPEAWLWYHHVVGGGRCPIVDTWWQTETGGFMIMPLPGAVPLKPGSAGFPFFGVQLALVDAEGKELQGEAEGALVVLNSWPGQMRTIWGDPKRYASGYFEMYPGKYFTGDGARRDRDGYYWITGRVDDVINVSGHRLGTAEVESALVATGKVAEAAVVGYPHSLKGQGIYAYVTLKTGLEPSEALKKDLVAGVRKTLGPIATPDVIQWAPGLPKTRSGKIMRRILRKIAAGEDNELGDTSTLADPAVVGDLVAGAKKGQPSAKL